MVEREHSRTPTILSHKVVGPSLIKTVEDFLSWSRIGLKLYNHDFILSHTTLGLRIAGEGYVPDEPMFLHKNVWWWTDS